MSTCVAFRIGFEGEGREREQERERDNRSRALTCSTNRCCGRGGDVQSARGVGGCVRCTIYTNTPPVRRGGDLPCVSNFGFEEGVGFQGLDFGMQVVGLKDRLVGVGSRSRRVQGLRTGVWDSGCGVGDERGRVRGLGSRRVQGLKTAGVRFQGLESESQVVGFMV